LNLIDLILGNFGTAKTVLVAEASKIKLARYKVSSQGWMGEKKEENMPDKIQVIVFNFRKIPLG
jgi:hypothetical protein